MTDDKKPDGWVAYGPKGERDLISNRNIYDELYEYYEIYLTEHQCRRWADPFRMNKSEGWRIRPVRLVFLDEVET
jgi:hypothetical protein